MEIVKAFKNNNVGMNITIKGTYEEPLFRASDIGIILEMSNINKILTDFTEDERVSLKVMTSGGEQVVTFLTEKGLYQVLFTSRKPIAKQFKNWVCEVIKEIRINNVYDLQKQLDKTKKIVDSNESNLLFNFDKKKVVYLCQIDDKTIKFGYSDDIKSRLKNHKNTYGEQTILRYVFESVYNREVEILIKKDKTLKQRIFSKEYADKLRTELIALDDKFTLENLKNSLEEIKIKANDELLSKLLDKLFNFTSIFIYYLKNNLTIINNLLNNK